MKLWRVINQPNDDIQEAGIGQNTEYVAEDLARFGDKNGVDITNMKGRESWHSSFLIWT